MYSVLSPSLSYSLTAVPILIGLYWAYWKWRADGRLTWVMYAYIWLCLILSSNILLAVNWWVHPVLDRQFMILDIFDTPFTISMPVTLDIICYYVLQASRRNTIVYLLQILPSVALTADYALWYALSDKSIEQLNRDGDFNLYCTTLFNVTLCIELLYFLVSLTYHYSIFYKKLVNYAVDLKYSRCTNAIQVVRMVWLYLIMTYIILLTRRMALSQHPVILMVMILIFCGILVYIGYLLTTFQPHDLIYTLHERDFTQAELQSMAEKFMPTEKEGIGTPNKTEKQVVSSTLEKSIKRWTLRIDKPYMRQNLTLDQVAEEMKIAPKMLSLHLNNIYQLNFNAWINTLKIEEAKRLLVENMEMPASEIAIRCNYNDAATFAKVFKKVTGLTPIQYRKEAPHDS